ncbi:MAG: glycosyltransferase [Planctomycetales bacterium]|nr:glycosyltransferase [Planctomycetales bacterium]
MSHRLLVLGGTHFLGRSFCECVLQHSAMQLTLLNRGQTNRDLFAEQPRLICDRNNGAACRAQLADTQWDYIVDFSGYEHQQIENIVTNCRCAHYTFISTSAVDLSGPGDELFFMAQNKLWCEHVVHNAVDKLLTVRAGYVVGHHDPSGRFEHRDGRWVWKGTEQPVQPVIEVEFLASLILQLIQLQHTGIVRAGYSQPRAIPPTEAQRRDAVAVVHPVTKNSAAADPVPAADAATAVPAPAAKAPAAKVPSRSSANASTTAEPMARIVATILSANNEAVIGDAIRSIVDWVDAIVLVDTGSSDRTCDIARQIAGDKLRLRQFAWEDDFGAARNQALEYARGERADWALTLDTDERMLFADSIAGPASLRARLAADGRVATWLVASEDGSYAKERWIRMPTELYWQGRTHETLCGVRADQRRQLSGMAFREQPKTEAEVQEKLQRDLRLLRADVAGSPQQDHRWYYLGQTLANLGQHEGAITAFDRCAAMRQWDELAAWACYMSAKSLAELGLYEEAIERCALGLSVDAHFPELAWMSGWCYFQTRAFRQAIAWSHLAISLGCVSGIGQAIDRVGFRDLVGWYEGPYDILRYAHEQLGELPQSLQAGDAVERARAMRLAAG